MKKWSSFSFIALIVSLAVVSCGERYEEETGSVFDGTWTYLESFVDGGKVTSKKGKFIQIREFEGENFLLFYTNGRYDSSFFYRVQNDNVFVRKVQDSTNVIYRYPLFDKAGDPILDEKGKQIIVSDTVREPQKPLNPQSDYAPEKYYGTYSFEDGAQLTMTLKRFRVNASGAPTTNIMIEDIYIRPKEIE